MKSVKYILSMFDRSGTQHQVRNQITLAIDTQVRRQVGDPYWIRSEARLWGQVLMQVREVIRG